MGTRISMHCLTIFAALSRVTGQCETPVTESFILQDGEDDNVFKNIEDFLSKHVFTGDVIITTTIQVNDKSSDEVQSSKPMASTTSIAQSPEDITTDATQDRETPHSTPYTDLISATALGTTLGVSSSTQTDLVSSKASTSVKKDANTFTDIEDILSKQIFTNDVTVATTTLVNDTSAAKVPFSKLTTSVAFNEQYPEDMNPHATQIRETPHSTMYINFTPSTALETTLEVSSSTQTDLVSSKASTSVKKDVNTFSDIEDTLSNHVFNNDVTVTTATQVNDKSTAEVPFSRPTTSATSNEQSSKDITTDATQVRQTPHSATYTNFTSETTLATFLKVFSSTQTDSISFGASMPVKKDVNIFTDVKDTLSKHVFTNDVTVTTTTQVNDASAAKVPFSKLTTSAAFIEESPEDISSHSTQIRETTHATMYTNFTPTTALETTLGISSSTQTDWVSSKSLTSVNKEECNITNDDQCFWIELPGVGTTNFTAAANKCELLGAKLATIPNNETFEKIAEELLPRMNDGNVTLAVWTATTIKKTSSDSRFDCSTDLKYCYMYIKANQRNRTEAGMRKNRKRSQIIGGAVCQRNFTTNGQ